MKWFIIIFTVITAFVSCSDSQFLDKKIEGKDKKTYSNKFEEFIDQSDTLSKLDNSTYNLLVDSLKIRLNNYAKKTSGIDGKGAIKNAFFSMTTGFESSHIYYAKIILFKSNKLAFENYANRIGSLIDDSVSGNRLKNFEDIINIKHNNWKFIYLENMTIELYEPLNDVNLYVKKLLFDKDYKEIEFYREGAFWTKNNNPH